MPDAMRSPGGLAYDIIDMVAPWETTSLPIVFHHGIGTNRHVWSDWLGELATRHRCIRFDTRGYGHSAVPPEDHRWSLEGSLGDLMEMVGLAGGQRVHLVGESFGGTVALLAACRHPDLIASVSISNAAFRGASLTSEIAAWRAAFKDKGVAAWSSAMMAQRFVPGALDEARYDWFKRVQDASPAHVTAGLGSLLAETDLSDEVARLQVPLLILMPDRSPFVTTRMAVDLAERVAHAELVVFPGTRHGLPFSNGRECGARVAQHARRAEAGTGK